MKCSNLSNLRYWPISSVIKFLFIVLFCYPFNVLGDTVINPLLFLIFTICFFFLSYRFRLSRVLPIFINLFKVVCFRFICFLNYSPHLNFDKFCSSFYNFLASACFRCNLFFSTIIKWIFILLTLNIPSNTCIYHLKFPPKHCFFCILQVFMLYFHFV